MFAYQPERYIVHTEVFDGPLELLLYLIRRDGVDVCDIPIAHVTREYLSYLDCMLVLDLDVAGDFLVMAALLCEMKSRDLLPRPAEIASSEEEEADPRQELARRLMEYERFRQASQELSRREWLGRDVFTRPSVELDPLDRPVDPGVDAFGLLETFYRLLEARAIEEPVHEVTLEEYSLQERVGWLLSRLSQLCSVDLHEVLGDVQGRHNRVVTFLALLEMVRLQMVNLQQERHLGPVALTLRVDPASADLSAIPREA